jgi:hypothetical protein
MLKNAWRLVIDAMPPPPAYTSPETPKDVRKRQGPDGPNNGKQPTSHLAEFAMFSRMGFGESDCGAAVPVRCGCFCRAYARKRSEDIICTNFL